MAKLEENYNNFHAAALVALAASGAMLWALRLTGLAASLAQLIPFADLWICLSTLILASLAASLWVCINSRRAWALWWIALAGLLAMLVAKMATSGAFELYYADYSMGGPARRNMYLSPFTWALSLACCALLVISARRASPVWFDRASLALAVASAVIAAQYNLLLDTSPYTDNAINLGVVVMPVINLFHGALLPLDAQSQYGYYAYLLVPLLKLTGLNIVTMSMLFAALFFLCLVAIYHFTRTMTGSPAIAFVTMVAAFFLNTSFGNVWPGELYFQYRPIRMLAPCAALLLCGWHSTRPGATRRWSGLVILSLLVIWNSDSGIPTLAAYTLANAFGTFFQRVGSLRKRCGEFVLACFEGIASLVLVLCVFALALYAADGKWLTPALFFEPLRIWRKSEGFFTGWSQAIHLTVLVYGLAIVMSLSRGVAMAWRKEDRALFLTGLTGVGIATYGTLNPQATALTSYLLPVVLAQLATLPHRPAGAHPRDSSGFELGLVVGLLPVSFIATAFVCHIKDNGAYQAPIAAELIHPSPASDKSLWIVPGASAADVEYVKVKALAGPQPPVPPWLEKARWLKSLPYLSGKGHARRVFIASVHDHFLYAVLEQASPIRLVNFVHIPIFNYWPLVLDSTRERKFDFIVMDQTYLLRNNDSKGTKSFDAFASMVATNYDKVDERDIGQDWYYPGWRPSTVTVYKRKAK